MNLINEFFRRRSENMNKEQNRQNKEPIAVPQELTDDLFWEIINRYLNTIKNDSQANKTEILSDILAEYPENIIKDFGKRFEELNK